MNTNTLTKADFSLQQIDLHQFAVETNYTAFLNSYCREFSNWHRYSGLPHFDATLAAAFKTSGHDRHLKFDFAAQGVEVYAPLRYFSESGRHLFHFPVIQKTIATDEISELSIFGFVSLTAAAAREEYPGTELETVLERVQNSIQNLNTYLSHYSTGNRAAAELSQSFIDAEQSLILGHIIHPIPKGKTGFSENELLQYSPETAGKFQLHYVILRPDLVDERSAGEQLPSQIFRSELNGFAAENAEVTTLLAKHHDWKVLALHPWEAKHLLKDGMVQQLITENGLIELGPFGPDFTPTSSVRTVYNAESNRMYKFSLHVKITNSERVNLLRELHRGYDISRLLKSKWGSALAYDFPEIEFVNDSMFYSVHFKGEIIEGFNTSVRRNPFTGEAANKNVTLMAALCQDGLLGQDSRLQNLIRSTASKENKAVHRIAEDWFKQYLSVSLLPLVGIYNKFGLACEAHQQNVMVELDGRGFPAKLYFRDNQGFFFRLGKADELLSFVPDLADESMSLVPEEIIHPKYTYYLLINNILGLTAALGGQGLADEEVLLDILYRELKSMEPHDQTGLVSYILHSRNWTVKANLLTSLHNMDEARQPMENPAIYLDYANPLSKRFFSKNLMKPETKEEIFSRYFEKEELTISLRPFDIDRDLEMVHGWFNEEHARPIWKMDGPIKDLESFYRMLMDSDHSHSFIGMINGEPTFTIEPYWPMRDGVGRYYDALPGDYGVHLLIAPTDKNKKYTFLLSQTVMDFVFAQPEVGKCIGEAAVESRAMHILVTRMGFRFQKVLAMPHKNANLTYCEREWYWEKFPESKSVQDQTGGNQP